jgi:hypothetical protein
MNTGNIAPLYFALPLAICLVIREVRWRNRVKNWDQSEGRMLGFQRDPDKEDDYPVIGYTFMGEEKQQFCEINLHAPTLGATVPILINPESGEIFVHTFRDRWNLSAILLICVSLLVTLSILSN